MIERNLVHVVDDEDSIRRSLDFLLRGGGYEVERWCDGSAFLKGVEPSRPACVLLDVRMPGIDGLGVQKVLAERGVNLPVIMLTGHGDITMAVRAMQAGAVDFLEKPADRERILKAVETAFARLKNEEMLRSQRKWASTQVNALTEREREVLDGLACGYPNKTIAYDLGISARTVEVYRANAMTKLEVSNFADALRIAFAAGFGSESRWQKLHCNNDAAMQV